MIRSLIVCAAALVCASPLQAESTPAPTPAVPETVPAWKLAKAVKARDAARDEARTIAVAVAR